MEPVRIGITMGDPAGVGPEIIAQAVCLPEINKLGRIIIIGDRWVFEKVKSQKSTLRLRSGLMVSPSTRFTRSGRMLSLSKQSEIEPSKVKNFEFVDLNNVPRRNFKFGRVAAESGGASVGYLDKAVELIKNKQIDCLVTAPISKEAVNKAGYKFGGHTEFLARAFDKKKDDLAMMLINRYIRTSLVTRHLALSKVSATLNEKLIYNNILITHRALLDYFALKAPRLCVVAVNPHAGEAGLLGKEEINLILPAIKMAKRLIKNVIGPLPADTAFPAARGGRFDAVIVMYHDQALIPLKLLDFDSGVNVTLGLDFVRTSPLHGTGFDIAGKNIASSASLIAAIKTAVGCTLNLRKVKKVNL